MYPISNNPAGTRTVVGGALNTENPLPGQPATVSGRAIVGGALNPTNVLPGQPATSNVAAQNLNRFSIPLTANPSPENFGKFLTATHQERRAIVGGALDGSSQLPGAPTRLTGAPQQFPGMPFKG